MSLSTRLLSLAVFCGAATAQAQQKTFTIAEATNGLATTLAPKSISQASWQPGTHNFFQVVKSPGADAWVRTDLDSRRSDTIRLKALNSYLFGKDSLKSMPGLTWRNKEEFYFQAGNRLYFAQAGLRSDVPPRTRDLPEDAQNVLVDKNEGSVAYTVKNNVWLLWSDGSRVQVTADADLDVINGQAVHRNEFGIDGGLFFSPRGTALAYYHMDQRMVADYPIIDWLQTPAVSRNIKYPMAGDTSHEVQLRIYHPAIQKTVTLDIAGPKDQYLTAITWAPDEKTIFVGVLNRDQNHLWLNQYDAITGKKIKTVFEETNEKYVEPQHPLSFIPGSNTDALWWSQRDGYMHLYRYNMTTGKLVRQITKGAWIVNELVGFGNANTEVIITGTRESPLEKHAYAVLLSGGTMRRLDIGEGTHNVTASSDGNYLYDVMSSDKTVRVAQVYATIGSGINRGAMKGPLQLLDAPDPLAGYARAQVRNVTLKADDGAPLYGKIILPPDFDSTRKYPVVVYLYNGPHVQLVRNAFPASGNLWYEYMAQRGYVMFVMDGRGSSNRGMVFESAPFRQLGTVEMNDQLVGVNYLKTLPYIDPARMGVHGWSFGGFMTTSLMTRHPDVFKCAVAGGPVMDWSMYEVMYTERYMDSPQQNPEGYKTSNLLTKMDALRGKLLLIHGTDDDVVVWQHSIKFLKGCVDKGVQVDYFVYPGHLHNVRGKDRVHLMQKISDYFDLYLKP